MSPNHVVSSPSEHAAVSPDHATVQKVGHEFVMDYFGRLNNTGRVQSVADMFAERARFCAIDVPDGRLAVGRADAIQALRRFCRTYGGGGGDKPRRSVTVVSVDTLVDECDCDCRRDGDRYELFAYAEWTLPVADTCAPPPSPFVQTFLVRRPRDADGAASNRPLLEILRTTVKVIPSQQPNFASDKIHSESEKNVYTTPKIQSNNKNISSLKNQSNDKENQSFSVDDNVTATANSVAATVFSKPSATSTRFSYDGESSGTPRSFGMQSTIPGRKPPYNKRMNQYREFETYQKRVETFLKSSSGDSHQNTQLTRLCVDGLDASFTANDLYAAFGRFGTVLWVRIMPADNDVRAQAVTTSKRRSSGPVRRVGHVCFERSEDLSRAMEEQRRFHGCVVRGTRMSVRIFDQ